MFFIYLWSFAFIFYFSFKWLKVEFVLEKDFTEKKTSNSGSVQLFVEIHSSTCDRALFHCHLTETFAGCRCLENLL